MTHDHRVSLLAHLLLEARRTRTPVPSVPQDATPLDTAAAYAVQDAVAHRLADTLGPVRGWKIGASSPEATPSCAPLHEGTLFFGDTTLPPGLCRFFGVEAEIVYRFARDLPWRDTPWTEADIRTAIGSVHPAIEIFDTRFPQPFSQEPLVHTADQGNHGALIIGAPLADWNTITPLKETVHLDLGGTAQGPYQGRNTAGDPVRLLVWLANHAMARGLPLRAGDVVTTGSMTGTDFVSSGTTAQARFATLGSLSVTLPAAGAGQSEA